MGFFVAEVGSREGESRKSETREFEKRAIAAAIPAMRLAQLDPQCRQPPRECWEIAPILKLARAKMPSIARARRRMALQE
ncbi:MAG: hypothetical protein ACFB9N_09125 [Geitlerinemataceae cyanobacterium]